MRATWVAGSKLRSFWRKVTLGLETPVRRTIGEERMAQVGVAAWVRVEANTEERRRSMRERRRDMKNAY